MNSKKYILVILNLFLCFILFGCAGSKYDEAFAKTIGLSIQHYLHVTYTGSAPIDTQTMISFHLENKTNDCVQLLSEPDPLYIYSGGQWKNIPDNLQVSGTTISARGTSEDQTGDSVNPDYSSIPLDEFPIRMRVVFLGKLCNNGKPAEEITADYTEVIVNK